MIKQSEQALVSFIILGWNNKDLLAGCFDSILEQTYKEYSVIYVDNGSSDGSIDFVKKRYPEVTIVDTGANLGFAVGNNRGIEKALENPKCRYVAFLNSDARLAPDWLHALIPFADKHPKGASFQSATLDYYDHTILDSYGIKLDMAGRAIQLGYRQKSWPTESRQVFGVNAAAALYSRVFLDQQPFGVDYFDSDMWMYLEDADLATRAIMMGWESWYVNQSEAYHMGSATSGKNPGFSTFMTYRNNGLVLAKNLPIGVLLRMLPRAVFTEFILLCTLVRYRNKAAIKAIIKGRIKCLPMLPGILKKRRILHSNRSISNRELLRLMRSD